MNKEKSYYGDKPLLQRIVLFLAGFSNFIMGYALYFTFKDDKSKEWQIEFIQRGATFSFAFFIIGLVLSFIISILSYIMARV